MRRSISIMSAIVIFAAAGILGACSSTPVNNAPAPKPNTNVTPVASPSTSPVASPSASPSVSPVKPGASPEVKKPDDKKVTDGKNVNKDAKPVATATPKAK